MKVITIGRECGSGGHTIAKALAKELGIPCYNKEIISMVAKECDVSVDYAEHATEKIKEISAAAFGVGDFFIPYATPSIDDQINGSQIDIIRRLAEKEACIIVGRGADYILKDFTDVLRVFIYAPMDYKIEESSKKHELKGKEARNVLKKRDKERSKHYYFYSGQTWGDKENYDLCIDASRFTTEQAVQIIKAAYLGK